MTSYLREEAQAAKSTNQCTGNLTSLRNLILGRCLNTALSLPKLTHSIVSLATSIAGQSTMDNLSHEFPFDTALAAVHLFCASSDAALLRKYSRLAVLVAGALREAEQQLTDRESLATHALVTLLAHLRRVHAAGADGAAQSIAVRTLHRAAVTHAD